jgi:hypothetical protein
VQVATAVVLRTIGDNCVHAFGLRIRVDFVVPTAFEASHASAFGPDILAMHRATGWTHPEERHRRC